jgi:penicillin amidase
MEVWRHIGAGRLSELFGESQLDTDKFIRTLDWRGAAQRDLDAAPQDVRDAYDAYAAGVNAWLDDHAGALGPAFVTAGLTSGTGGLGGYRPEPWTPLDTVTWQKVQAWGLSSQMGGEIFRLLADARLGDPAKTDQLFPASDPSLPVVTPPDALMTTASLPATPSATASIGGVAGAVPAVAVAPLTEDELDGWGAVAAIGTDILRLAGLDTAGGLAGDHGIGSNNWVVSGSKSASGSALLANDPHLGFSMPSVWIMNGLHCRTVGDACPWDAVGVTFPGVPAIVLGHNARVAWGVTNVGPDVQDLFQETVDPSDPTHYLFKGESIPFDVRHETIKVAGGDPVEIEVRSTRHGPVLNDVESSLKDAPPTTLRWTTLAETDGTLTSFFHLGLVRDFTEFREAFRGYGAPSQNAVYADVDGHIGYVLPGLIPIRDGVRTGDRVRDGASGTEEWTGYIPFDELPWQYDPPSGFIVTANNASVDTTYPYHIASDFDPGWRAQEILDRLRALPAGRITAADLRSIQMDTHPLRADTIIPFIAGVTPRTADGRLLLDRIDSWDGNCDVDSRGCAAYVAAEFMLTRAVFDDELGPLARDYVSTTESWQGLIAMLKDPTNGWWDDTTTPARETPREVIPAALDAAAAALRDAFGDPGHWTWGRMHTITFEEQTLGVSGIGPLEWFFDQGPRQLAGVAGAVNNNSYRTRTMYADPDDASYAPVGMDGGFDVTNGPSYRLTIDMAAIEDARIVITTGQSGNPFDRHYGDLIDDWATGGTVPLAFSWDEISASTASTLTLTP